VIAAPAREVEAAAQELARSVEPLRFAAPVTHVYNPLRYAWEPHQAYLRRYATGRKQVLYLGMNPGPFGMAQTGVPFGEVRHVREWLGIEGRVGRPRPEHPRRPVEGFACRRSEVSGARLWGAIAARYAVPERFFAGAYIANYCPLMFLEASGRNRTPDALPRAERDPLFERCDVHLRRLVAALEPQWVIGVGAFAESRARTALSGSAVRVAGILHPSPASPRANQDWAGAARGQLQALGLCKEPAGP
jgi:single-strand selective monofunctional uracil DNA glycosylase